MGHGRMNSRRALAWGLVVAFLAGMGVVGVCAGEEMSPVVTNREVRAAIERSLPY